MMVNLDTPGGGRVRLEDAGFTPAPLGRIIRNAMTRRKLTVERVSQRTGLGADYLQKVLDGRASLDLNSARKLERIFPHSHRLFLNVQRAHAFYERHKVLRPRSPLKRWLIETGRLKGEDARHADRLAAEIPLIARGRDRLPQAKRSVG